MKQMTPDECEFYARPENQEPQGPPRHRRARLSAPVPARLGGDCHPAGGVSARSAQRTSLISGSQLPVMVPRGAGRGAK